MKSLVDKVKNAAVGVVIGAASLFGISGNAGAEMIGMESRPTITSTNADGSKNLKLDIYLTRDVNGDGSAEAPEIRGISSWKVAMPSELQAYLTPVSAQLPDMVNKKSKNTEDILYNTDMRTIGGIYNKVNNFVSGVSSGNQRDPPQVSTNYSSQMSGIVATYQMTVANNAPNGVYNFVLDGENQSTQVYDRLGQRYNIYGGADENHNLQITNQSFEVTPEPATAALLALGGTALLFRTRRRNSGKWVDPKTLEGKTGSK